MTMRAICKNPGIGCLSPRPGPAPFPFGHAGTSLTFNARAAIRQGLHALGLEAGERILMPAYHCGSEVDVVLAAGLRPVFYRLDRRLNADADHVRALTRKGCAAIYGIDYFGYPQPAELADAARACGARLIRDLALGLYSTGADGPASGADCDMAVFSLVKSAPLPDGGALHLAPRWRAAAGTRRLRPPARRTLASVKALVLARLGLRRPAMRADAGEGGADPNASFEPRSADWTPSLATLALLAVTDHRANAMARRRNYDRLHMHLAGGDRNRPLLPPRPPGACPAFFPLWSREPEETLGALRRAGIEAVAFWRRAHPAVDLTPFPFERRLRRQVIRLPVHHDVSFADIDCMAEVLFTCGTGGKTRLQTQVTVP